LLQRTTNNRGSGQDHPLTAAQMRDSSPLRSLLGFLLLAVLSACGPKPPPPRTPQETAAVDSLVHLLRKSLSEKDPAPTFQAVSCLVGAMYDRFGETRGDELIKIADSRAYTWRDYAAKRRRDDALAGHWFSATCVGQQGG
jgi:hypothetical protein